MESKAIYDFDCTYIYLGDNRFKVIRLFDYCTDHFYSKAQTTETSINIVKTLYPSIYPYLKNPYFATFFILSHRGHKYEPYRFYRPRSGTLEIIYNDNGIEYKILVERLNPDEVYLSIGEDIKNLAINPKELIDFL